jgi:Tol biopolymer transport system component
VPSRLISGPADDKDPVWSPDGREIVFSSDVRGDQDLLRKGVQANEPPGPPREEITRSNLTLGAEQWCPIQANDDTRLQLVWVPEILGR